MKDKKWQTPWGLFWRHAKSIWCIEDFTLIYFHSAFIKITWIKSIQCREGYMLSVGIMSRVDKNVSYVKA